MSNTFVWVDIPVVDLDRAIAFYGAVLGRGVDRIETPDFSFGLFKHEGDEVGGCLVLTQGEDGKPSMNGPLVYLDATGRLDAALAAVQAGGGRIVQAKHPIGPHGWRAIVADTEGNRVALHSPTA